MKENYRIMKEEAESKKAKELKQAQEFRRKHFKAHKEWLKRRK